MRLALLSPRGTICAVLLCYSLCSAADGAIDGDGDHKQAALPAAWFAALRAAGIPEDAAAVVIRPLGAGGISADVNGNELLNPASTMKLVTTYAALDLLGPDWRWRTDVLIQGELDNGTLSGDLFLRGSGDPTLVVERFWLLIQRLRALGIENIDGDLVLDKHAFVQAPEKDPADFDGAALRPYNVTPDALLLNFKSVAFTFVPDPAAGVARLVTVPKLAGMTVQRTVPALDGPCGDWMGRLDGRFDRPHAPSFRGGYPTSCGERTWYVSLLDHSAYVAALFRALWESSGGSWEGALRDGAADGRARLIASHQSPPLAEVVRSINKFSNNVMTRQLFLTLGGAAGDDATRSVERARSVIETWLAARQLADSDLLIDNGAGLSRSAQLRPAWLADLLVDAFNGPLMPEFMASLPVPGVDGTARRRAGAVGAAHVKTGLLRDVRAVAGYVHAASGQRYVVVAIINHANAGVGERAHDVLLNWLQRSG